MALIEVLVPDIGDFKDVEVIEVLVKEGERITREQSLVTVESDKASMEIPSPGEGVVRQLRIGVGDRVSEGSMLLVMESSEVVGGTAASVPGTVGAPPAPAAAGPAVPMPAVSPPAAAGAGGQGGNVLVEVPDIGDFKDVEVIEILVKPGDAIGVEQSLVTVESDKASMEIPSSAAGVVSEIRVKVGDKVSKGSPIALVAVSHGGGVPDGPAETGAASTEPPVAALAAPTALAADARTAAHPVPVELRGTEHVVKPHASPSVRKFARELGVDLAKVRGTGPKQRITPDDVRSYVKGVVAQVAESSAQKPTAGADGGGGLGLIAWPKVDFARFGPIETRPLPRIKKISAANLHRNWVMIPHVTNHDDADITDLESFRIQLNQENAKSGAKVTMLAFLVKACVAALKKFPEFNSSLDGDQLVLKNYYHIGVAADTPNGLVVPVIRDADKKGIVDIAREMSELAGKAREGKLSPGDMQGGTFSISSLGGIGGTYFTPIINAPEVAILGVCRSQKRPVWSDEQGAFVPRLILPLSLSWDHRVIDGAAAARFNVYLGQLLADFRRVML
jgi:pyruvate dehydrogenase E2 component (dihydrolipoamide acetyltransferase)